jgi:hypothetical protein
MIRRITIVCVALVVALVAVMGATDAVAKKKKKPKALVGPYVGRTVPDGIDIAVTLDPGRATGSISYCGMVAPFATSGTVYNKSFAVNYTDPNTQDVIIATGFFSGKRRSVSGSVAPNGCDSVPGTFTIQR